MKSRWKTKAPCGKEGAVCRRRRRTQWRTDEDVGTRNSRKNEPSERRRSKQSSEEAVEAMPKTVERTLSGSETAPPFHRTRRISLNYCAAYFFRKDGVCVALAYLFTGRVRRLFFTAARFKYARSTLMVRYGTETFFWPLL